MFKKIILLSISLLWIPATLATQTTLNFQNPQQTTKPGAPIPPSDFANQVKATNTQKHTQFKQQLDQQKSALSHPQIPSLSQVQNMSQTQPPPVSTEESESTSKPLTTHTNKLKPNQSTSSDNAILTPENTQESAPATPAASGGQSVPPPPTQNQPYTGFPQSQPSNSTAPKNSGGFNIKY